jgi:hypothetical protein
MEKVEKVLMVSIAFLFISLIISQILIENEKIAPYVNKTIQYEGVVKKQLLEVVETIDRNK